MIDQGQEEKIGRVAGMITKAENIVVFTGAGISTESGIPDFRSPGGFWTKFDPEDFTIEKFLTNAETRRKQWRFFISGNLFQDARPNAAHEAIAELERLGRLNCVITQNIDNLHQRAGNGPANVFELHGNMRWIRCLGCGKRYPIAEILQGSGESEEVPVCGSCTGILKPDVIFFGETLPEKTLKEATGRANRCDLLIVVGSSLVVYPAAYLPLYAKQAGAGLVIVNLSATPADNIADVVIHASAGEVMGKILAEVRQRLAGSCA
ncbi:MAG: NAD-dependent deacylase [Deltaproteobacteria bacterium]|nr:NAD-dependent deacylase [Deltaproteobacteria bacterium]